MNHTFEKLSNATEQCTRVAMATLDKRWGGRERGAFIPKVTKLYQEPMATAEVDLEMETQKHN